MALVNEGDEVLREIVYKAERPHPLSPSVKISGVILDSGAIAHFLDEFKVVLHPLLEPLGLEVLAYLVEIFALGHNVLLNLDDCLGAPLFCGDEISGGIDGNLPDVLEDGSADWVNY